MHVFWAFWVVVFFSSHMLLLYELHLSPAICTCAGLFCLLQSRHGYCEFHWMRSYRQGQINVSGFFWLSHIRAASSFWRLCSLVQQVTQRRQVRRKPLVTSDLYHGPCFNFYPEQAAAEVWARLHTLLSLAPAPASSSLELCVTQRQRTPISCTPYAAHKVFLQFSPISSTSTPFNFCLSSPFTSASPRLDLLELFFHVSQLFLMIILIIGTCKAVEDTNKSPTF